MPNYNYECETCGPFAQSRPMAEFDKPQPCPDCGEMAARLLTLPAIAGGAQQDMGGGMPTRSHPGGCACCAAPGRFCAEAV
ncbi:MAG: FmdB family zinc ribbon protein [Acetobacteraceae bacterium]